MSSENIILLVKKAKSADKEAFGDLYAMYCDEMYRFAYWYLGDKFIAEDAVSEAAINAFISIRSIKNPEKFKSWLFKILLRCCQKQLKTVISLRKSVEIDEVSVKDEKMSVEQRTELKSALSVLSDEDREIILLSSMGNLTSKEIGELMSIPSGTVRSKISRATDRLYDILSERSVEDEK